MVFKLVLLKHNSVPILLFMLSLVFIRMVWWLKIVRRLLSSKTLSNRMVTMRSFSGRSLLSFEPSYNKRRVLLIFCLFCYVSNSFSSLETYCGLPDQSRYTSDCWRFFLSTFKQSKDVLGFPYSYSPFLGETLFVLFPYFFVQFLGIVTTYQGLVSVPSSYTW